MDETAPLVMGRFSQATFRILRQANEQDYCLIDGSCPFSFCQIS